MKVRNFKEGLLKLLPALDAWQAKEASRDFLKLIELMDGHEDMTVDAFCKKARLSLEGAPQKSGGSTSKDKGASDLRDDLVDSYVADLTKFSKTNDEQFVGVISKLKSDKQARVKEVKAIASGFMGYAPFASKRDEVITEITGKHAKDLRTQHKFKILEKW